MAMSRCTGHCCREFGLPVPLAEIIADPARFDDGETLVQMIVPLRMLEPGDILPSGKPSEERGQLYTCNRFDAATGNCTRYDERPAMCRNYPYGRPCEHLGCTLVQLDGRQDKHARASVPDALPIRSGPTSMGSTPKNSRRLC